MYQSTVPYLCANTYFDTICVHPLKSAYTLSKMRTVKLTDKLEFERIIIYLSVRGCPFRIQIFQRLHR